MNGLKLITWSQVALLSDNICLAVLSKLLRAEALLKINTERTKYFCDGQVWVPHYEMTLCQI